MELERLYAEIAENAKKQERERIRQRLLVLLHGKGTVLLELLEILKCTGDEEGFLVSNYTPGDYQCVCNCCGRTFIGDKRAMVCLFCASLKTVPNKTYTQTELDAADVRANARHDKLVIE